jgi:hypothetical protein
VGGAARIKLRLGSRRSAQSCGTGVQISWGHAACHCVPIYAEQIKLWRRAARLSTQARAVLAEAQLAYYKGYGQKPSPSLIALVADLHQLATDMHDQLLRGRERT